MSKSNVNLQQLQRAAKKVQDASDYLKSIGGASLEISSYSMVTVDQQIKEALAALKKVVKNEQKNFSNISDALTALKNIYSSWDEEDPGVKNTNPPSNPGTGGGGGNNTNEEIHFIKEIQENEVIDKTKPIFDVDDFIVGPFIPINPPVNPVVHQLEMLKYYLEKGDLTSATKAYKFLKAFGKQADADALLAKYGYKVEEKDGEYIISKVEENKQEVVTPPTTDEQPNEEEVVADETVEEEKPQQDTVVSDENNNQNNDTVVTPTTNNNNSNNNNNGGSNTNYNSTSSNQNVVENTSTDISGTDATTETETITDAPADTEDIINNNVDEDSKTNVVTITDDSETTITKKSSGLGAAVPIGLGTIAAGAAAVAGVRYVKNRHENQEEYSEEYDDENNNLDSDSEYQDSAQYDSESTYMDDDYLGPIDTASSEDGYVDPTDLEEIEELSDDSVLEELNSNY